MTSSGYHIPVTEQLAAHLDDFPISAQQRLFENAVHKALDAEGWPAGERGTVAVPNGSYYVVLLKHGVIQGHVGPLLDKVAASRTARSWRGARGVRTQITARPIGPCLTNKGLESRDIYYP